MRGVPWGCMFRLLNITDGRKIRRITGLIAAHRLRFAAVVGSSILAGLFVLLLGQGLRRFVDRGLHGAPGELDRAVLWLALLTLAYGATTIGRSYFANFIGNRIVTD